MFATLRAGDWNFKCRAVLLDNHGTLVEFDGYWHAWAEGWVDAICRRLQAAAGHREAMLRAIGFAEGRVLPHGPLAMAGIAELAAVMAAYLYAGGMDWVAARVLAEEAMAEVEHQLQWQSLTRPIAGVREALMRLRAAGLKLAVLTADTTERSLNMMRQLGMAEFLDVVLGSDAVPYSKPAPYLVQAACARLGLTPGHTVMVGDSVADMMMARRAGVGLAVGVLSGVGRVEQLAAVADVVVGSVRDIEVEE